MIRLDEKAKLFVGLREAIPQQELWLLLRESTYAISVAASRYRAAERNLPWRVMDVPEAVTRIHNLLSELVLYADLLNIPVHGVPEGHEVRSIAHSVAMILSDIKGKKTKMVEKSLSWVIGWCCQRGLDMSDVYEREEAFALELRRRLSR